MCRVYQQFRVAPSPFQKETVSAQMAGADGERGPAFLLFFGFREISLF